MKCGILSDQKNKLWVIKAMDCSTRDTVECMLGGRDAATFRRLYDKVKHLQDCTFYTDHLEVFSNVFPPECHAIWNSLADFFDVSLDYLVGRSDQPNTK